MKRRNVILGGAAAGASLVAALRIAPHLPENLRSSPTSQAIEIHSVGARNDHDQPHTLSLTIKYDGEEIHSQEYTLGTTDAERRFSIDDLPEDAGEYEVTAALDDGQSTTLDPEDYTQFDCAESAFVLIEPDGRLTTFLIEPCNPASE